MTPRACKICSDICDIVLAIAALAFIGWMLAMAWRRERPKPSIIIRPAANIVHVRPCVSYPHALVRCGVWSLEDVEAARADSMVAAHYADIGTVRPAVLKADEWDYASFRQGAQTVWTARPLLIKAGELVLMDRAGNKIRARCGNRLSPTKQYPAMPAPPELERDIPAVTVPGEAPYLPLLPIAQELIGLPPLVAFAPPVEEIPFTPVAPFGIPPVAGVAAAPVEFWLPPIIIARGPVIHNTPEPDAFLMVVTAMVLVCATRKRL